MEIRADFIVITDHASLQGLMKQKD